MRSKKSFLAFITDITSYYVNKNRDCIQKSEYVIQILVEILVPHLRYLKLFCKLRAKKNPKFSGHDTSQFHLNLEKDQND